MEHQELPVTDPAVGITIEAGATEVWEESYVNGVRVTSEEFRTKIKGDKFVYTYELTVNPEA